MWICYKIINNTKITHFIHPTKVGYWLIVLSKAKVILDLGVVAIANEFLETIIDIDGELKNSSGKL